MKLRMAMAAVIAAVIPAATAQIANAVSAEAANEAQVREAVARVRADMRSMATAIETYYVDYNVYPPSAHAGDSRRVWADDPLLQTMPTTLSNSLTTPIAYMTGHFSDPFNPSGAGFSYFSDGPGWILTSPGPDGDFDLDPAQHYKSSEPQPSAELLLYAFDPTNGTVSDGDLFRVKQ